MVSACDAEISWFMNCLTRINHIIVPMYYSDSPCLISDGDTVAYPNVHSVSRDFYGGRETIEKIGIVDAI